MHRAPSQRVCALVLLLGIVLGFGGAVLEGRRAAVYSKPSGFRRFHAAISPEGKFFPTLSMMENLALAAWQPGRTLVVIGGNSILQGYGQQASELWSLDLQVRLGPQYAVVNLAFPGSYPSEGAALVVESLIKRGIPVLYVTNTAPGPVARPYESNYGWLYWDAWVHGRLLTNRAREAELAYRDVALSPEGRRQLHTAQLAARLNAALYFQELWQHVSYRHFFTVWAPHPSLRTWRPRAQLPDLGEGAAPLAERFRTNPELELQITRNFCAFLAEPDGRGGWSATTASLGQTERDLEEIFVPEVRRRTLMLLVRNCPYFLARLEPGLRDRDDFVYARYEALWREHGVRALTVGTDFTDEDYRDRAHLAAAGGRKLAALVAQQIRQFPVP